MANQKCKGARDLLPRDTEAFRFIEELFRKSCASWGYQEVRTPTLEYLHLFTAAGTLTPNMLSKVYSFLDWDGWSGERVVLRPDGTIPVARLYVENLSQQGTARLFYITNVFVFEETGRENRERWQCGAELIGSGQPASDVELILLASQILRVLDIGDIQIQLSHAGMLKALLKELKLDPEEEQRLTDRILEGNWQVLTEAKLGNSTATRFMSLLLDLQGKSSSFLENLKALPGLSTRLTSALENFILITTFLDVLGYKYQIDITSTTDFEYYTGLCFQFSARGSRVGSGGRYDSLIPLIGGMNTPACGFALYVDPLISLVQPKTKPNAQEKVSIRCARTTPETLKTSFQLADSLRRAGYIVEFDFDSRQSNWRWAISVQDKTPTFVITDQIQKRQRETSSIADVIGIIGGST